VGRVYKKLLGVNIYTKREGPAEGRPLINKPRGTVSAFGEFPRQDPGRGQNRGAGRSKISGGITGGIKNKKAKSKFLSSLGTRSLQNDKPRSPLDEKARNPVHKRRGQVTLRETVGARGAALICGGLNRKIRKDRAGKGTQRGETHSRGEKQGEKRRRKQHPVLSGFCTAWGGRPGGRKAQNAP